MIAQAISHKSFLVVSLQKEHKRNWVESLVNCNLATWLHLELSWSESLDRNGSWSLSAADDVDLVESSPYLPSSDADKLRHNEISIFMSRIRVWFSSRPARLYTFIHSLETVNASEIAPTALVVNFFALSVARSKVEEVIFIWSLNLRLITIARFLQWISYFVSSKIHLYSWSDNQRLAMSFSEMF